MAEFLSVARDAAIRAGRLLRENLNGRRNILYKGGINLVTEMDRRSEQLIVDTILSAFPDHGVLAEEEARINSKSGFTWIIDPLDGTTNYAHRYPCFSVSIALMHRSDIISAVVYDPMRDELFHAEKDRGAFLNDRPIRVSSTDSLIQSLLSTGFPYDRAESSVNNIDYFIALLMASQEMRRDGSAALDLCSVAAGRFDGFWELKLQPWDVASGSLIVREAGGVITDISGGGFDIYKPEIVASNGLIHGQMLEVLKSAGTAERGSS